MVLTRIGAMAVLLGVLGCNQPFMTSQAGLPAPQPTTVSTESAVAPTSIPIVQLITPEQNGMHYFAPSTSGKWVFSDQAGLSSFVGQQPAPTPVPLHVAPPGYPSAGPPPSPPPRELPDAYSTVDFDQYQAIAYVSEPAKSRTARIVGIEENSDHLLVHTVQWVVADNIQPGTPDSRFIHVVLVPKTPKQVVFARTLHIPLVTQAVRPSPQVGVPEPAGVALPPDPDARPRWKAVPNPEITSESIETRLRTMLGGAQVDISIEKLSIAEAEARDSAGSTDGFLSHNYLPGSEVWRVEVVGQGAGKAFPGTGAGDGYSEVVQILSIEDGMLLTSHLRR